MLVHWEEIAILFKSDAILTFALQVVICQQAPDLAPPTMSYPESANVNNAVVNLSQLTTCDRRPMITQFIPSLFCECKSQGLVP